MPDNNQLSNAAHGVTYSVTGTVVSPEYAGVGKLTVQILDKNAGPDVLLACATTDAAGKYVAAFKLDPASLGDRLKTRPDLQARALVGTTFLAASEVRYNASTAEVLDIQLPADAQALPSEYELLTEALADNYRGSLSALQEKGERSDFTYLANKTGWDARAVALAALADQFSQITAPPLNPAPAAPASQEPTPAAPPWVTPAAVSLKPEFYYALFRAGVPANANGLFQTSPNAVRAVWEQAVEQGVIPQALVGDVPDAVQRFQALSAAHGLDANPPVGPSTFRQMLQTCLRDGGQQTQFAQAYVQHRDDPAALWGAVRESLGEEATERLQLHGQLFYLTSNNAPLVEALQATEKENPLRSTRDLVDLVARGYYDPAKWTPLIEVRSLRKSPARAPRSGAANTPRCWRPKCALRSRPPSSPIWFGAAPSPFPIRRSSRCTSPIFSAPIKASSP
jgi:hypothetical protein